MKFTQKDACEELVKQMTANGETLNLSQRSINAQIENLIGLIANDETELSDFVSSVLPFIKTADANVRNDVSHGIKAYKDSNPPTPQKDPQKKEPNDSVAELLERINALEQRNLENERLAKSAGVKSAIIEKLKELGVKNEKWVSLMVDNLSISDDTDAETEANGLLEIYNTMIADVEPNATPKGTNGTKQDYNLDTIKEAASLVSTNIV